MKNTNTNFDFGSVATLIVALVIGFIFTLSLMEVEPKEKQTAFSYYDMDSDGIEENISHIGFENH